MNTPTETQLVAALAIAKEKAKLNKEIEKAVIALENLYKKEAKMEAKIAAIDKAAEAIKSLQKTQEEIDGRILSALGQAEAPAPKAAKAPKAPKTPKAEKEPKTPEAPGAPETPETTETPKAAKKTKAPKEPKTPKAPKAPKAAKTEGPATGEDGSVKRGKLGAEILRILKAAGPEGVNCKELANQVGRDVKQLYVWNSNIGRKQFPIHSPQRGWLAYDPSKEAPQAPTEQGETPEATPEE